MSDEYSRISTNSGHGHIWERPDGMKARCGGAGMCSQCAIDKALYDKFVSEKAANSESNDVCLQNSKVKTPTNNGGDLEIVDRILPSYRHYIEDEGIQKLFMEALQTIRTTLSQQSASISERDKRIAELEGVLGLCDSALHAAQCQTPYHGKLNDMAHTEISKAIAALEALKGGS